VKAYWYWPYLRSEEYVIAAGVVGDGDRLVVDTTARADDPVVPLGPYDEVRAVLPGVADRSEGTLRWAGSRATTYLRRARLRRRAVRTGGFDVAHVMYLNPFTDAFDLASLGRRVALVSTVHDVVPHHRRMPERAQHALLLRLYRSAGTLVVHHPSVGEQLVEGYGVDPARVVYVPPDVPVVDRVASAGAADGRRRVLFFGTFRRNKGVAEYLAAIERLRDLPDVRFVFAGRGFDDIERLVRDAAARDSRIEAEIGYVTPARKDELHAQADLVVLPYTSFASQSGVLLDAYAHRVPLVVTDVGALGATVRADGTGWVVPPGDPAQLADAVAGALGDDGGRAAAAHAAETIARDRTPAATGRRLRAVYEGAIARRERGVER
jgi:glycosyltransferase involved in cell wall biosynthesis